MYKIHAVRRIKKEKLWVWTLNCATTDLSCLSSLMSMLNMLTYNLSSYVKQACHAHGQNETKWGKYEWKEIIKKKCVSNGADKTPLRSFDRVCHL